MSELSDTDLLNGLLNNDYHCINRIYEDNFIQIRTYIVHNNGDLDEAKDVFQEALIVLFEKVKSGSFTLSSKLGTFLFALCKNIWLKKLSKKKIKETHFEDIEANDLSDIVDGDEWKEKNIQYSVMDEALFKLGEPCKTLLESFYIHKMDMKNITEVFGYTNADNAKTQKYKCLMRLKKIFFDKYNRS